MQTSGIKVRIFNSEYNLQGENTSEVERVANYVDNIMHKISYDSPNQSGETIAVVSALNIAESYFKEKETKKHGEKEHAEFIDECTLKLNEINRLLDENL
jgi:cell division protein ZapA